MVWRPFFASEDLSCNLMMTSGEKMWCTLGHDQHAVERLRRDGARVWLTYYFHDDILLRKRA
jgi:hypothetical protein